MKKEPRKNRALPILLGVSVLPSLSLAQSNEINTDLWYTEPGIIGTIVLCIVVLLVFCLIMALRIRKLMNVSERVNENSRAHQTAVPIAETGSQENERLKEQGDRLHLTGSESVGQEPATVREGLVQKITHNPNFPLAD